MTTFSVGQEGPVNALALNKDNTQVAIGGRNVFKVYNIEEESFKEICNLRASKHLNLSFSCNDVAWSSNDDNYLATAATNGHVCVWNLTKMGKAMQEQVYQEHKRTVNKVNFHVSEPYRLISGSQDGTMRYFDLRCKAAVAIFYSNTESVRDVQFSPHQPYMFAAVSENGSVQLWDVRKTEKLLQQFTAHSGPVFACDWHPEVTWLATASRDKTIKVWDLTSKPTLDHTIHTIASIGYVKWRPQRKFHIASCALVVDCSINIWDVRRPYIPFASFNEHKDITSRVVWRGDPHTFLSTSRDCSLYQHAFNDASRPASKANPQGISLSKHGRVLYASRQQGSPSSNNKPVGLIRKSSNTISGDQFHLASSSLQLFQTKVTDDNDSFKYIAKNYVLTNLPFHELCERNANVARERGKSNVSVLWKIVKTMYADEYCQKININNNSSLHRDDAIGNIKADHTLENEPKTKGYDTPQFCSGDDETENEDQVDHVSSYYEFGVTSKFGLPKGDFSFGENELDLELDSLNLDYRNGIRNSNQLIQQEDWHLPNEAFNVRHEILDRSPPPEQFSNHSPDVNDETQGLVVEEPTPCFITISKFPKKLLWDPSTIVVDTLKHYAMMGDVQTAVCILTVLGEHRKTLKNLDELTQEHWLLGYIELLGRSKLWSEAAQLIKLSWIPGVFQLNQQSTRINTSCSQCLKPLQRIGWLCDRCHSSEYSLCSVCHAVVKGLYSWCQGCSHGGHITHMQQWFVNNKVCPTGCGHLCEFR